MEVDLVTGSGTELVVTTSQASPSLRGLHILDLPDELLIHIFKFANEWPHYYYLRRKNVHPNPIVNLRMTCRPFAQVGDHLLVPSIRLYFQQSSLDRIEAISQHPSICKGVKEVSVSLKFFSEQLRNDFTAFVGFYSKKLKDYTESEWGTEEEHSKRTRRGWSDGYWEVYRVHSSWQRIMSSARSKGHKDEEDETHQTLLKEAHNNYKTAYDEQQLLHSSGIFLDIVAAAMSRMPLAKSLGIHDMEDGGTECPWNIPVRAGVDV